MSLRALSHLQDVPHPWLPENHLGTTWVAGEGRVGEGGHRRASELMQGTTLPHSPGPAPNAGAAWLGSGRLGPEPRARFRKLGNDNMVSSFLWQMVFLLFSPNTLS